MLHEIFQMHIYNPEYNLLRSLSPYQGTLPDHYLPEAHSEHAQ